MKKFISFVGVSFVFAAVVALGVPAHSFAANYAYVSQTGEVKMYSADNASIALANAPGIHMHSGVILLTSSADNSLVGKTVSN